MLGMGGLRTVVSIRPCHYLAGEPDDAPASAAQVVFQSAPAIIWQGNPPTRGDLTRGRWFQSAPAIIWQGNVAR